MRTPRATWLIPECVTSPWKSLGIDATGRMKHWPTLRWRGWLALVILVMAGVGVRQEGQVTTQKAVLTQLAPSTRMVGFHTIGPSWLDSRLPQVGWIRRWCEVRSIGLSGATVDDVQTLDRLPSLEELWLRETTLTSEHVESLERLTTLRTLRLSDTPILDSQLARLAQAIPDVEISVSSDDTSP